MNTSEKSITKSDIIRLIDTIKWDQQNLIDDYYTQKITGSTLSKETLSFLKLFLDEFQPKNIVEFGCGLSTSLISDSIHTRNDCRFYSIDNIEKFIRSACSSLKYPEKVHFIHAPIEISWINYCPFVSYSKRFLDDIKEINSVDLLVIDGPYGKIFWRDAPLFLTVQKLKKNAVILLDDSHRPREQETIHLWKSVFGDSFEIIEVPEFHKGLSILLITKSLPPLSFSNRFRLFKIIDSFSCFWKNRKYMETIKVLQLE